MTTCFYTNLQTPPPATTKDTQNKTSPGTMCRQLQIMNEEKWRIDIDKQNISWVKTSHNLGKGAGQYPGRFTLTAGVIPGIKIDFSLLPAPAQH